MNNIIITEASSSLRLLGREALRGKWKLAVLATLVYGVAVLIPMAILDSLFGGMYGLSTLSSVYSLLVTGAFTLGYSIFCMSIFRNKEAEVAQVFYGFERFGKALGLVLVMGIFVFLWSLLFIVPGIIAAFRYSQAFYIMVDNPNLPIMECIRESKRLMTGNKGKLFCLELSFIGWALLCSLPVAIITNILIGVIWYGGSSSIFTYTILTYAASVGYLWLTPYMTVTSVGFYEMLIGNLKPNVIETTAQVVPDQAGQAETYKEPPEIRDTKSE